MRRALTIRWALAATLLVGPSAVAQPSANETLLARADSITVGDYCRVAQGVLATPGIITLLAHDSASVRSHTAIICDPLLSSFSLRALGGNAPAPLAAVARVNNDGYSAARRGIFDSMSEFRATVLAASRRNEVNAALGPALRAELSVISTTAQNLLTGQARDRALERLARYERKLGPTSAKLNAPEVMLNYVAQRWVPLFRATPLGGPSPLEIVASYAPGYLTVVNDSPVPVSASELGVRYYLFGERFGRSGTQGLLFPTYFSVGMLTASDRNGALVWPWEGKDRMGGYLSWGAIKVGYIGGRQGEWLVSKQFQAVPFVF